jgi:hypothetical protein
MLSTGLLEDSALNTEGVQLCRSLALTQPDPRYGTAGRQSSHSMKHVQSYRVSVEESIEKASEINGLLGSGGRSTI